LAADLAIASARVRTDIVEASEFPQLSQRYAIYQVPKTIVNETGEVLGAVPEAQFVDAIVAAVAPAGTSGPPS
jgi:hypothetical protein